MNNEQVKNEITLKFKIVDILYILMPYVECGIYAVCGYFLIEYTLRYFEDQI